MFAPITYLTHYCHVSKSNPHPDLFPAAAEYTGRFRAEKPAYQYMQLFYYGRKTMAGPIGHFSPALRGQTDIALTGPTAYMKLL